MIGFKPSFFLFLFISVGLAAFGEFAEFVPLPFAPAINGIVFEGEVGPGVVADGSVVSLAPFIVS